MAENAGPIIAIRSFPGYVHGFRTASLLIEFDSDVALRQSSILVLRMLEHRATEICQFPVFSNDPSAEIVSPRIVDTVLSITFTLLKSVNIPMVRLGKSIENESRAKVQAFIPAPIPTHTVLSQFVQWFVTLQSIGDQQRLYATIKTELPKVFNTLRRFAPTGSNIPHLLSAARELDIPVVEISGRILQFGQGKNARWLDSSFTDQTPHLAAVIARNKLLTAKVLHDAGIPVPPHALVKNLDQAIKVADKLGYPVVIKPADMDGGVAVAAGLQTPQQISQAFDNARKYSKNILLEKHIKGRDYRLNIFRGELLWAIERVPAGVMGDGKHTIRALLNMLNADERRGEGIHAQLKKVALDDEAHDLLKANNRDPDSVPQFGEYVPLRRRANIAAGGTPISVMNKMHQDNIRLAIRATAVLGLDIAGVDLLIPDITKSWMEVGGAICEINGQPQLGSVTSGHVYREVLSKLVNGDGRIPITLVLDPSNSNVSNEAVAAYKAKGLCVGYAGTQGIFVGDECICRRVLSPYQSGQILLRDRRVEAIVLETTTEFIDKEGLPIELPSNPNLAKR